MKFIHDFFFGKSAVRGVGSVADFFLRAPQKEKIEIFTKAAKLANEDQRETTKRSILNPTVQLRKH